MAVPGRNLRRKEPEPALGAERGAGEQRGQRLGDADRKTATGYRLFRNLQEPGEVFVQVEFASSDDALTASERLRSSGVLERFSDRSGPSVVEEVETVRR